MDRSPATAAPTGVSDEWPAPGTDALLGTIEWLDGMTVLALGGGIGEGDPGRLVERVGPCARSGALAVDLSAVDDLTTAAAEELLWRLGTHPCHHSIVLVHTDLGARRRIRRGTALPVLPTIEVARASHLPMAAPPAGAAARRSSGPHTSGRTA